MDGTTERCALHRGGQPQAATADPTPQASQHNHPNHPNRSASPPAPCALRDRCAPRPPGHSRGSWCRTDPPVMPTQTSNTAALHPGPAAAAQPSAGAKHLRAAQGTPLACRRMPDTLTPGHTQTAPSKRYAGGPHPTQASLQGGARRCDPRHLPPRWA